MGVSNSPAELIAKIEDTVGMAGKNNKVAIKQAATTFKAVGLRMLSEEIGSEHQLSRWRWMDTSNTYRPLKLYIWFRIEGERDATATIEPRPLGRNKKSGPWSFLESGRKAYTIVPKRRRVRRQERSGDRATKRVGGSRRLVYPPALRLPNGQLRYSVRIPSSPGRRLWTRIGDRARRPAWERYQRQMTRETIKRFQ